MSQESRAGRPKSDEKANAILEASSQLFLEHGFQCTSMDAVARTAGVSKQTVYSHFESKEALFRTCIERKLSDYGFDVERLPDDADLRTALLRLLRNFAELLFDTEVVAMFRVVIADAAGQGHVAALFHEAGPARSKAAVVAFLDREVQRGRLRIAPERRHYACNQLLNMTMGTYHMELLLGRREHVPRAELERHLERVADDFLSLHGAPTGT